MTPLFARAIQVLAYALDALHNIFSKKNLRLGEILKIKKTD